MQREKNRTENPRHEEQLQKCSICKMELSEEKKERKE